MVEQRSDTAQRRGEERLERLLARERELWARGFGRVAGVDEAGLGPLAGPVIAAAVVFPPEIGLVGVNDSKQLAASRREELAALIREQALDCSVARVDPVEIDRVNILRAGHLAMRRAVEALAMAPDYLLIDGRHTLTEVRLPQECLIKGDGRCHAIAAASILAKTERDALMRRYDREFPGYGFAAHKGYATASHRDAIRRMGPTPIHRMSFTLLPPKTLFD
jgi:ribonuclease HII